MPKVSIIIPIYNVADYLLKSVRSAIEQTERDIEVILVDDGSTDNSGALCDELAQEDFRIQVIHKENGGLSSARNAGVAAARGDYVLLLDGDDYLLPHAAARVLEEMERCPSDIIQFHYQEVAAGEEAILHDRMETWLVAHKPKELFQNLYSLGGEGASACTKLFRRELLARIPFEPVRHEDEMWCTRAYIHPLTVSYIPDVLYCYVMRGDSIIHDRFNIGRLDIFRVCEERIKALQELGLTDLLGQEYSKLFLAILTLYRDAANAGDRQAMERIRTEFKCRKEDIRRYSKPQGKFKILFHLMYLHFGTAELYRIYWSIRK